MILLSTSTNTIRRETTVTAKCSAGHYICSETWTGTGARVATALARHVRTSAEQLQRRQNIASTSPAVVSRPLQNGH
ncbi:hypothetical protein [Hymenobacter tenuis]